MDSLTLFISIPDSIRITNLADTVKVVDATNNTPFNIATLIQLSLVIINILLFIILHYRTYNKRKTEDRIYNSDVEFYKILITNNINRFFLHTTAIEDLLKKILQEPTYRVPLIQSFNDKIEDVRMTFEKEFFPIISCFDNNMKKEVNNITDEFYSKVIPLFTNLSLNDPDLKRKSLSDLGKHKFEYIQNFNSIIKKYNPIRQSPKKHKTNSPG